jgi:hypothetical protein
MRRILMSLAGVALILAVGATQLYATCLLCGVCACGPANYSCGSRSCYHYGCYHGCVVSADYCCPPLPGDPDPRPKKPIIVAWYGVWEPQISMATQIYDVVGAGNLDEMISKIAAELDVPVSTVHLRTAYVAVDAAADLPDNPGTSGTAIGNQGFIVRRDPLDPDATASRYRLCRFTPGGPATLLADLEVGQEKALITSMVLDGRQLILAIQPVVYDEETFEKDYETIQGTFWLDAAEHLEEAGLTLTAAEATTECE